VTARSDGELALVLHTHMPYVEGFDTWPFGEEWLWEAVASVYVPLLRVLDGAPVTVGLTPVLCDQLEALDGDAGDRLRTFLTEMRPLVHRLDIEALGGAEADELRRAARDYEIDFRGGLIDAFAALDGVELWTSSATHAVLPLLATEPGLRLQIGAGVASHVERCPGWRGGFWLPECAYVPGLERALAERGVRAFCVDQTDALGLGSFDNLEPVRTAAGPVAVPIDWETVSLVWHESDGYPASGAYRAYTRRTEHDLRPWNVAGEVYDHAAGTALAREHARAFVAAVGERLDRYREERGRSGLVCCALDTELLGHWWYEGVGWLRAVIDECDAQGVPLLTVSDALRHVEPVERPLAASTWGKPKDMTTWDSPRVADIVWRQRSAELRCIRGGASLRAVRELLALQSSDWAFLHTFGTAGDYPARRVELHAAELERALAGGDDVDPRVRGLAPRLDLAPLLAP
jgi:1,4-alpha-glucan branching enzyme